jgi:hypothetical protein
VRLADAPAFQNRDIAVVARNAGELSQPLAEFFGESEEKATLIPVAAGDRIAGGVHWVPYGKGRGCGRCKAGLGVGSGPCVKDKGRYYAQCGNPS